MKRFRSFYIVIVLVVFALLSWRFWHSEKSASTPSITAASKSGQSSAIGNATLASEVQIALNDPNLSTKEKEAIQQNPSVYIKRLQVFQDVWNTANSKNLDFYGEIVDQFGQPVPDANVAGNVMTEAGFAGTTETPHQTKTNANGLFQFTGLHGASLGIVPSKQGYEYNLRTPSNWSAGYVADANNPVIFTMWKIQNAEPLTHVVLDRIGLPCDGTMRTFDLLTGKSGGTGDINITFIRDPINIVRGKPFSWTLTLTIPTGGLTDESDPYPYEAPASGYKQTITFNMTADAQNWSPSFIHTFYFTMRDNQVYGRITVDLMADYTGPKTHFEINSYANPTGSRTLEPERPKMPSGQ